MPREQRSDEEEREHDEGLVEQGALLAEHDAKCETDLDKLATKRDAMRASVCSLSPGSFDKNNTAVAVRQLRKDCESKRPRTARDRARTVRDGSTTAAWLHGVPEASQSIPVAPPTPHGFRGCLLKFDGQSPVT